MVSDKHLLDRLRNGDRNAYDEIFVKYYHMLCINALFYLKDEEEAKDLVQHFFLDFWEKKLYLGLNGEIKGYLYRSIQNSCFNYIRDKGVQQRRIEKIQAEQDDDNLVEFKMVRETLYIAVERAMYDLPTRRRDALNMVYLQSMRYQEAADLMGISINSLKTHLKMGLKNLRDKMKRRNNSPI